MVALDSISSRVCVCVCHLFRVRSIIHECKFKQRARLLQLSTYGDLSVCDCVSECVCVRGWVCVCVRVFLARLVKNINAVSDGQAAVADGLANGLASGSAARHVDPRDKAPRMTRQSGLALGQSSSTCCVCTTTTTPTPNNAADHGHQCK